MPDIVQESKIAAANVAADAGREVRSWGASNWRTLAVAGLVVGFVAGLATRLVF
jgi:hypothetical protein